LGKEINGKIERRERNGDVCQIGTDAADGKFDGLEREFTAEGTAVNAERAD